MHMPIKILATADLHLGKSSSAVPADSEESSTKHTWRRMIDWAIGNDVEAILMAGDIIDQDNRYFEAIGPLQAGFDKLSKQGIQVYLVTGNHDFDVLADIIRNNRYDNIHLLGADGTWEKKIHHGSTGTIQLAGWSFPSRYVTEDPLASFDQLDLDPNEVTIGLLHSEANNPESRYGPVDLGSLRTNRPDAWILGHIHKPTTLHEDAPYIAYPGTPHALNSGEPGAHGPLLLEIEGKDEIRVKSLPLSPVRYETITIPVEPADDESSLRDTISSTLMKQAQQLLPEMENTSFLVCDLHLTGHNAAANQVGRWAARAVADYEQELETGTHVMVRKATSQVQPAVENLEELAGTPSPAGKLAETILAIQKEESTPFLQELTEKWEMQLQKINRAATYEPLNANNRLVDFTPQQARSYILHECNHMLNHLINQQQQ